MATNSNNTEKMNAVIISSYKYDHPFTDMACAWSTIYTIFYTDAERTAKVSVGTGWGQSFEDVEPNVNIIPMTDAIRAQYKAYMAKCAEERVKADLAKFQTSLDAYNEARLPQNKGQVVEILEGKHKGKVGRITWFGHSKFNRTTRTRGHWLAEACGYLATMKPYSIPNEGCDLILVRPVTGSAFADGVEKVYVSPDKCKVVEGFEPITMTADDVRRMHERHDDICDNLHVGTAYDYRAFV